MFKLRKKICEFKGNSYSASIKNKNKDDRDFDVYLEEFIKPFSTPEVIELKKVVVILEKLFENLNRVLLKFLRLYS